MRTPTGAFAAMMILAACGGKTPEPAAEPALNCQVGVTLDFTEAAHFITVATMDWRAADGNYFAVIENGEYWGDPAGVQLLSSDGFAHDGPAYLTTQGGDVVRLADGRLLVMEMEGQESSVLSADGRTELAANKDLTGPEPVVVSGAEDWVIWTDAEWNGSGYDLTHWIGHEADGRPTPVTTLPLDDYEGPAAARIGPAGDILLVSTRTGNCGEKACGPLKLALVAENGADLAVSEVVIDGSTAPEYGGVAVGKVLKTADGFAVQWKRWDADQKVENRLTMVGEDGSVGKTIGLPDTRDIVWSGDGFTLASLSDDKRSVILRRLDADGAVIGAGVIADLSPTEDMYNVIGLYGESTRFAVSWLLYDKKNRDPQAQVRQLLTFVDCDPR